MNAFQAIVKFIADEASLKALQARVNGTPMTQKVTMDTSQAQKAVSDLARQTKVNSMQAWASNNSKAMKTFGTDVNGIIKEMGSSTTMTKARFNELNLQFKQIQNNARLGGQLGKSMFDKLGAGMQKFAFWTSSTFLIMKGVQEIKQAVNFAKEFDSALANINYTMGVTKSELNDIGQSSMQMAKDLKTSAEDVLGAVTLYANAKETADSILKKSETALMLGNVTGMSGQESAKALQSVMNQFDLTQDDLMYISDTIQKVSQNMAYDFSKLVAA